MSNYYLIIDGKRKGPYTEERVRSMRASKSIEPGTLCLKEGEKNPKPIEQFSEITSPKAKGQPASTPKNFQYSLLPIRLWRCPLPQQAQLEFALSP